MGETITLTASDGFQLAAYLAEPAGAAKGGIVVVQEIFGVNVHIRAVCDGFAADGYRVVAPAMFDREERGVELGYQPDDIATGRAFKAKMDMDAAIRDVAAAAGQAAPGGKAGIVGYCWGGLVTYVAACRLGDSIACASSYYGGGTADFLNEKPSVPIIFHFGSEDQSIPLSQVEAIEKANPDATVYIYEGADHGFNCDHRGSYNAEAAAVARGRTLAFFDANIG